MVLPKGNSGRRCALPALWTFKLNKLKAETSPEGKDHMSPPEAIRIPKKSNKKLRYRNLSIGKLVKEIVDKSDRLALQEFHNNRTLFSYNGGPPLHFIHYLNELRESWKRVWTGRNAFEVAEKAYDFTIDKFSNLPRKKGSSQRVKSKSGENMKRRGADCRLYFKAFLEHITPSFETKPPAGQIEEEARAAITMQGLVKRHFYLSILEAERRANPFWSRYYWRVRGGTICVWLPVSLEGRERPEWLEKNIDNPDPLRQGESERIQAIISQKLARERFVSFNPDTHITKEEYSPPWSDSGETFEISLAQAVAEEKSRNIRRQRRSIGAIGKGKLKKLVLRIFDDISCDEYEDRKVARDFGLSKATFSRFAGSRWLPMGSAIPDLWRNTAEVISKHTDFEEAAKRAGVWEQVETALRGGERGNQS